MSKTVRWVQYEAAVFVRIEVDEDGWDTEITKVVTANDVEELHLARDDRGHFMVYNEKLEQVSESEVLDGIRGAVSIAEDRDRWPEKNYPAWDEGLDPRRDAFWYVDDEEADENDDEDEVVGRPESGPSDESQEGVKSLSGGPLDTSENTSSLK